MKRVKKNIASFAVCIDNSGYPVSLELHKIYCVLPDERAVADDLLRVIDESGEDYLFSAGRFIVMDLPQAAKRAILKTSKMDVVHTNSEGDSMEALAPRYSKEEFARRGDEIYERTIRPQIKKDNNGKFVVIDIDTGDFEIDADELVAGDRLLTRKSRAQMWVTRIGSRYARRFGPRYRSVSA